ncbi:MAG: S1-like domain-containing RNA-binding protein, partial [Clostridiales bacterium]|nr:S1-like domain-containing RNA-binding protein [Clostridiales bacterium]
ALLRVAQITRIGAFLDWGLEKDLLLPYKEQLRTLHEGDEILVTLYADKSDRLCATMKGLYHLLQTDHSYQPGDTVTGRIYEFSRDFGTFVAVDDRYSAMIPGHENTSRLKIGDVVSATVTKVKADGKLDLTLREKAYMQIDSDAEEVLQLITEYGGVLPFNDKASPEIIKREAHMSKNAFKRAVGHLYKERKIEFTERGIRLT